MDKLTIFVIVMFISALIGGFCWQYTTDTWLEYFDKEQRLKFWQCALIGCFPVTRQISVHVAVGTWLIMKFIK